MDQDANFVPEGPIEQPESPIEQPAPEASGEKKKSPLLMNILSWVKTILVAFILAMLIKTFLVVNATVMSGSMETTIMTGDRIMCNRLSYRFGDPKRFDIIAFDFIEANGVKRIYVKRIIGLPGETVEIVDGKVYIDGANEPLPDDFINPEHFEGNAGPFEVPDDHYFVLGDNRNHSYDSKSWPEPYLSREDILGKAAFRYYPSLGWLANM